jgi:hypothetical protein
MPQAERLGLSQAVGVAEQPGQVVEADGDFGMFRAEALFIVVALTDNPQERSISYRRGLLTLYARAAGALLRSFQSCTLAIGRANSEHRNSEDKNFGIARTV